MRLPVPWQPGAANRVVAAMSATKCVASPYPRGNYSLSFCARHKTACSASAGTRQDQLSKEESRHQVMKSYYLTGLRHVGNDAPQEACQQFIYQYNVPSPCWEPSGFLGRKYLSSALNFSWPCQSVNSWRIVNENGCTVWIASPCLVVRLWGTRASIRANLSEQNLCHYVLTLKD